MPTRITPSRAAFATVCVTALGLAACTAQDEPPVEEEETFSLPDAHLVSLGDSYAAMGGRESPRSGPDYCYRTIDNYPSLVGERAAVFEDVTCQGAVTDDLLLPRSTPDGELQPQLDALGPEVDAVTLTIGGNDIGFGGITDCVLANVVGQDESDCRGSLENEVRQELDQLPAKLDEVYAQIDQRTDGAVVITTGYLPLISMDAVSDEALGEACAAVDFMSVTDQQWAAVLIAQLNELVEEAAERNGAEFVLPEDADSHTACAQPDQRWADVLGIQTDAYPLHPTSLGQQAMADAVTSAIEN